MNEVDDFLQHHGVLGMKWGVRKQEESSQANKKQEHKKNYEKFQKTLKNLQDSGKGNDTAAVTSASQKYDDKRKAINSKYSNTVRTAKQQVHDAKASQRISESGGSSNRAVAKIAARSLALSAIPLVARYAGMYTDGIAGIRSPKSNLVRNWLTRTAITGIAVQGITDAVRIKSYEKRNKTK